MADPNPCREKHGVFPEISVAYSFQGVDDRCDLGYGEAKDYGIHEVEVEIWAEPRPSRDYIWGEMTAPCEDDDRVIVVSEDLCYWKHNRIIARAFDTWGNVMLDNLEGGSEGDQIEVNAIRTRWDVELSPLRARLAVDLVVRDNGFIVSCESDAISIRWLRVVASSTVEGDLKSHAFDVCDFGGRFLELPDGDGAVDGRFFDRVLIQALDVEGDGIGDMLSVDFARPVGPGKPVSIVLECDGESCGVVLVSGAPEPRW